MTLYYRKWPKFVTEHPSVTVNRYGDTLKWTNSEMLWPEPMTRAHINKMRRHAKRPNGRERGR